MRRKGDKSEEAPMKRAVVLVALAAISSACERPMHKGSAASAAPQAVSAAVAGPDTPQAPQARKGPEPNADLVPPATPAASSTPGAAAATPEYEIGAPKTYGNLTVFPVLSSKQEDFGPMTTLDAALAKHLASVHETGSGPNGAGAQVNTLVIENRGPIPVYVLAGTIVKGGKQDRQIGQDFIVGAHQTVPVDAYCVEHGRWTTTREGTATGGQFGVVGLLTDSRVRAAAEYGKDQGQVWAKVESVNAANRKQAASGTLLASVDATDVAAKRTALARQVAEYLASAQPADAVVGVAYAVDGKVRSLRWFAHHKLFEMFQATLVSTAAMEAITAQSGPSASGKAPTPPPPVASADVSRFVKDVQEGKLKEERSTPGLNVNDIRDSQVGYSSSTSFKAPAAATAPPKAVSGSVNAH
jgi:hypothetical protein